MTLRPSDYDKNGDIIPSGWKEEKEELISRSALRKAFHERIWYFTKSSWDEANALIDGAPTVEALKDITELHCDITKEQLLNALRPQGEWISVSERLPENRDWYLGLFKEPDTDFIGIPYICDYVGEVTKGTTNEGWILRHCTDVDTVPDYFRNLICVAWQPLPEPYKKGGAE